MLNGPRAVRNYKGETVVAVKNCIPHINVDLPLVSIAAAGVCVPIRSTDVLLATVSKPSGRA